MQIYTYEYVYNYFKEQNCELLEANYINTKVTLKYKCSCGNIWKTSFKNFKNGQRCNKCRYNKMKKTRKYTYEYVYNYFKEQNCELLETNYSNSRTPLKYNCVCGNISYITFDNFKNKNKRCKHCYGNLKLTFEYIKNYLESYNYKLLDSEYINNSTKLNIECSNGHKYKASFSTFQQGSRCLKCFKQNNYAEKHHNWKIDRTRQIRSNFLSFDLRKINILKNDSNYINYLNDKSKYSIDHIYPRIAFIDNNLDELYNPKLIKEICNSIDNLRIILKTENSIKRAKYKQNEFMNWFNRKLNVLYI